MSLVSKTVRKLGPLGGYALARRLSRYQPRILMYHRFSDPNGCVVDVDWFEAQVKHIKHYYQPFSLIGLLQYFDRFQRMPEHAVVITVDDGYRDFYDLAFPVLRKYGVPATLFVTTGFVSERLWLWPDKVTWLLKNATELKVATKVGPIQLPAFAEGKLLYRTCWQPLIDHGLSIPDDAKHQFIDDLARVLGLELPNRIPEEFASVSWDQLGELQAGGIEVGGHTVTHPTLGQVTNLQAREEIFGCRDELVEHLGDTPRTFCYPNGQPTDFQDFLFPLVKEAGFEGAVTAFPDARGVQDRFAMRRHGCGRGEFQFRKAVSGVEYLGHRLRKDIRSLG